jgi:hypothetical protein
VGNLVVLDYDEAGDSAREGKVVESGVSPCAVLLLLWCVRGLLDKDTLGEEQDCCRVKQLQDKCVSIAFVYGSTSLTGCAENKMTGLENTAPQTIANRIQDPACAIAPVPVRVV